MRLSKTLACVVEPFAVAFTERLFRRFSFLLLGAIVCNGPRTVANIVRTTEPTLICTPATLAGSCPRLRGSVTVHGVLAGQRAPVAAPPSLRR